MLLRRLLFGLLGTGILASLGVVALLYASVARDSGVRLVDDLAHPLSIRFDAYQRPYVEADTLDDALFAEGWLHARHRLWQMELLRRAAHGRLSELFGGSALESDKELWRMGVPQLGEQIEKNASTNMQSHVAAYVNGVNAGIDAYTVLPPEFLLLSHRPAPWTPEDVYAMGALMAFQSAGNMKNELLRLALFNELGNERAAIFLPDDGVREDFPFVVPRAVALNAAGLEGALARLSKAYPLDASWMPSLAFGSNGWVVSPQRSKSGKALFAFDSHDELALPNLFYEVHLFFEDSREIRGWSVAGMPGVINGYNEHLAWGFTNIGDTQDLFIETRSPDDAMLFKDGDTWYRARTEVIEIPVAGRAAPESLTVIHTLNGPLISEDPPLALRWSAHDLQGKGIESILALNLARNWEEFNDALDAFPAPTLNATYADRAGNIGFRTAGLIPIRGVGDGLIPAHGDRPEERWKGLVPASEMPRLFNPQSGFLAAANARVNPTGTGPLVSADNDPGYRIRRLQSVLSTRNDFTPDDMRRLQMDWYDEQAAELMPTLMRALDPAQLNPIEQAACKALSNWSASLLAEPQLAAPLLFQAWYRALAVEVFGPGMSPELLQRLLKNNYPLNHALDRLIIREQQSPWWRGDQPGVIRAAFTRAVEELRVSQGDDTQTWRLDRAHAVKLEHELGKAVPQLAWLFNATPAPWGGAATTVGRARYRYDKAYDVTAAATVRVVGEMSASGLHMQAVIPGGQSGHPLSAHYMDQFPAWLRGEQVAIALTPEQVRGEVLELRPNN